MYTTIQVQDKTITARLKQNAIDIISDEALINLVTTRPEAATDELVAVLKQAYKAKFNTDFKVDDASMAVEIWGHIYCEKFADAISALTSIEAVNKLAAKISAHCEIINIGTRDRDNNRRVWDWFAVLKPVIAAALLPAK